MKTTNKIYILQMNVAGDGYMTVHILPCVVSYDKLDSCFIAVSIYEKKMEHRRDITSFNGTTKRFIM